MKKTRTRVKKQKYNCPICGKLFKSSLSETFIIYKCSCGIKMLVPRDDIED